MYKKAMGVLCVIGVVAVSAALYAEKKFTYSVHGIAFDASLEFSRPAKAGADAMLMVYPLNADPGKENMSITMVLYDRNAQKLMGMGDTGLLNYTRTVFMGSADPGKPVERVFAGKKVRGQALKKIIPVPSTVEVYLITLSKGNKIGIGISYSKNMKEDSARQVIDEIAASLREQPGR
ncbi:MAG TPA: hypothetical protein PKN50_10665 [Spirochaetota bacterium]|nr:hypothetical protein [Spirochaetota bacterium]HPV40490.1 hypothetical protein [Spirochaetota bacterium]